MTDPVWHLSLTEDADRRRRTKRDGKRRIGSSHARDFLEVWGGDAFISSVVDPAERAAARARFDDARKRLANVKAATVGGKSGGRPLFMTGNLAHYSDAKIGAMAKQYAGLRVDRVTKKRAAVVVNQDHSKDINGNLEYPLGFFVASTKAHERQVEEFYKGLEHVLSIIEMHGHFDRRFRLPQ